MFKPRGIVVGVAAVAIVGVGVLVYVNRSKPPQPPIPAVCHLGTGGRPDPTCTPGALNPDVTQATIGKTICVSGWTATIRPPAAYTNALKVRQIRAYGFADTNVGRYEEDHLIPLELGGAPKDPRNLWPELRAVAGGQAEQKDTAENTGKRSVCDGSMTLAQAQQKLLADWGPQP